MRLIVLQVVSIEIDGEPIMVSPPWSVFKLHTRQETASSPSVIHQYVQGARTSSLVEKLLADRNFGAARADSLGPASSPPQYCTLPGSGYVLQVASWIREMRHVTCAHRPYDSHLALVSFSC